MKEIQEESLRYVAQHWKAGRFAPKRAWRRFLNTNGRPASPFLRIPAWGYAFAAAFAAVAIGLFLFGTSARTVVGATAAVQSIVLPDGTQATLAPGATLSFRRHGFGRRDRALKQSGQVYYAVARNEQLPFEISVDEAFVRVLGTRFQVRSSASLTSVDVVDGRVLFAARAQERISESDGLILTRGMHAELLPGADRPVLSEAPTANPAAWATHTFYYENTPLDSVLSELSDTFGCTLHSDAGTRFLTGEFEGEELPEILSLIESALGIHIEIQ